MVAAAQAAIKKRMDPPTGAGLARPEHIQAENLGPLSAKDAAPPEPQWGGTMKLRG
jgi:hypothetical protein